jgi:hypothetical protein
MVEKRIPMSSLAHKKQQTARREEEKENIKPKTGFTNRPSDKITKVKTADPFSCGKKHKTNFGYAYAAGGVPCRINHGGVKNQLQWD